MYFSSDKDPRNKDKRPKTAFTSELSIASAISEVIRKSRKPLTATLSVTAMAALLGACDGSAIDDINNPVVEEPTPVETVEPVVIETSEPVATTEPTPVETQESEPTALTPLEEAQLIVALGAAEAGREVGDFSGSDRSFRDELNVFLPSAIDVDEDNLRDNTRANVTLPIYEGVGPSGEPTYFIITETSTQETAEAFGAILSPKLRYGALPSAADAAQYVTLNNDGRIVFRGDVDFSPERILEMGEDGDFPPSVAQPGAVGDAEYSSLVVLPSGLVINAQIIANSTGTHDRLNEINVDERYANFQLLDGWQGGSRYYYHLVTDASDPVPATIELGVYAPRLANLPVFGQSGLDGETVLLGFSPNVNGLSVANNSVGGRDRQGLGSTITDQDLDPVNIFPFDPDNSDINNNYSPFWDAHLNMWTDEAINGPNGDQRRAITSFRDLSGLISQGLITSFSGSPGVENPFVFGIRASNAVINCPVILQPFENESAEEALAARTPAEEASVLVNAAAAEAGRTVADFTGADRTFSSDLNVFLPNTISIDMENIRDNEQANATLPLFRGIGPEGEDVYYILTEASTTETAEIFGAILSPKLRYGALPAAAASAQYVDINEDGLMVFKGTIDFSPVRRLAAGTDSAFPPSVAEPGAVGDDEYSSLVVLPSGVVVNAQIVANATGEHDRILDINAEERYATFQLLDGWQGGDPFYYHLVTDASDPGPATIELGVYAPRMANLPTFGSSGKDGETVLLGFSPNINGLSITEDNLDPSDINRQGLGSTITDQDRDPVNIFPFDPNNSNEQNNYSPMWDAHLNMWTQEAINAGERRAIRGFADLAGLVEDGLITSFDGSTGPENDFIFGLKASNAVINCPVILQPFEGELAAGEIPRELTAEEEIDAIVTLGASEANRTVGDFSGSDRSFRDELNVFLPSAIDVDEDNLRDNTRANVTLPIYEGIGPKGLPVYYIITEASTPEAAQTLGAILSPKLSLGALPSAADSAQYVQVTPSGRIIFKGNVDFSPERVLVAGEGEFAFPPSVAQPGAVGDAEYSSLVVLPSGVVINAQIVANSTGTHDRLNSINVEERSANFQLLDGWQGGDKYYYHLVTDASDPVPAAIELGTYAPRMANLPTIGVSSAGDPESVLLGFSPNVNGLTAAGDGVDPDSVNRQGLSSTIVDDDRDPVNVFPFDPDNSNPQNNYSPMWDVHLNMWTDEAINGPDGDQRRAITSFQDLRNLMDQGLITSFSGSTGPENAFVLGLRASNAIINCPVILQPFEGENTQ